MTRRDACRFLLVAAVPALLASAGCAGYRFGNASLYPTDIRTVYVPVFESNSFRRNLGEWLTEAVIKQIELKTPYKVVNTPQADSILTCKIITDTKRVIVEDPYDQPRETEVAMAVQISWRRNRGDDLLNRAIPLPQDLVTLSASGVLVPEYGQSGATAELQSIERIANQIVSLMEVPW